MSQLQTLLPSIDATYKDAALQIDLPAQGLRLPGIPTVIGPFGYNDIRASLDWSLVDLPSLHNYIATRHNFVAGTSQRDARHGCARWQCRFKVADQSRLPACRPGGSGGGDPDCGGQPQRRYRTHD